MLALKMETWFSQFKPWKLGHFSLIVNFFLILIDHKTVLIIVIVRLAPVQCIAPPVTSREACPLHQTFDCCQVTSGGPIFSTLKQVVYGAAWLWGSWWAVSDGITCPGYRRIWLPRTDQTLCVICGFITHLDGWRTLIWRVLLFWPNVKLWDTVHRHASLWN